MYILILIFTLAIITMEKYNDITDEQARKLLIEVKKDLILTDWKPYKNDGIVTMEYKYHPDVCDLARYLISTTIKKPINTLVDYVWDATLESMQKDDPSVKELEILEIGANYKVRRIVHGMSWPVWDRETVFNQVKYHEGNNIWLIGYSIDHHRAKLTPSKNVRTNLHLSVYKYTALDENTTSIQRVAQIDPSGNIPHFIVESVAGKAMKTFKSWSE